MKTYEYKGFNETGRLARGLVEALDIKEAREKLSHRGILAETVSPAGAQRGRFRLRARSAFDLETRALVYRELAALLAAGLPLAQSLQILIDTPELGGTRPLLASVRDRIRDGAAMADALAAGQAGVSPFEDAVIRVGERAGNLQDVLERLAAYLDEQQMLRDRIGTALVYPALVLAFALGLGILMMGVMVPRVAGMLQESGVELPALTRGVLAVSGFVRRAGLPLAVSVGLGFWLWRKRRGQGPAVRQRLQRAMQGTPWLGAAYAALLNLRFARTLALLLRGGVPLIEGLTLAGRATGNDQVAREVEREADAVRQGRGLADALRTVPALSGALPSWVEAGEASGALPAMLDAAATRYQQQWDRMLARFLALLEPMLILVLGGFVLVVALAILLPILSLNRVLF